MQPLPLHSFHRERGADFVDVNGAEAVASYGDPAVEYRALSASAGLLDFSFRSRLCLTGADRMRFLHGQVTNDIKSLRAGCGCYAALVNAKGKMESDLMVYSLTEELLLDFEPGFRDPVAQRLEKYIVADDVQLIDVSPLYGLLSVQGPAAPAVISGLGGDPAPAHAFDIVQRVDTTLGEIYLANQPRVGTSGFELFIPVGTLADAAERLLKALTLVGGRLCGWRAFELARVEAGVPRFGLDMDGTNFPQECGIENQAVSYTKGCYIGQEVLNRIHTMGHVNRQLCGLSFANTSAVLPTKGDQLFHDAKEVGVIKSAVHSPVAGSSIALALVRREASALGTELIVKTPAAELLARIVALPFRQ